MSRCLITPSPDVMTGAHTRLQQCRRPQTAPPAAQSTWFHPPTCLRHHTTRGSSRDRFEQHQCGSSSERTLHSPWPRRLRPSWRSWRLPSLPRSGMSRANPACCSTTRRQRMSVWSRSSTSPERVRGRLGRDCIKCVCHSQLLSAAIRGGGRLRSRYGSSSSSSRSFWAGCAVPRL